MPYDNDGPGGGLSAAQLARYLAIMRSNDAGWRDMETPDEYESRRLEPTYNGHHANGPDPFMQYLMNGKRENEMAQKFGHIPWLQRADPLQFQPSDLTAYGKAQGWSLSPAQMQMFRYKSLRDQIMDAMKGMHRNYQLNPQGQPYEDPDSQLP